MSVVRILVLLATAPAGAHDWDQQQVSATTEQLIEALGALLADPKLDAKQATAMQQREHEAAISTARRVKQLLVDYKKRIDNGYSQEDRTRIPEDIPRFKLYAPPSCL